MEKVTFFESIVKILSMATSIPFFIEIFILTVILLISMLLFYFKKSKIGKISSIIIYFVTLALLPISHFSFFVNIIDNIFGNFVSIIYFPSLYVYIFMILVTDILMLYKLLKNDNKKWYSSFDFIYFFIFQFLFFLSIRLVITYDIDIFQKASMYANPQLTSVLQISSYIFWIRVGIELLVILINRLNKFEFKKNNEIDVKSEDFISQNFNISNEQVIEPINNNVSTYDFVNKSNNQFLNTSLQSNRVIEPINNNVSTYDLVNESNNQNLNIPIQSNQVVEPISSSISVINGKEDVELLDVDMELNDVKDDLQLESYEKSSADNYFDDFYE